MIWQPGGCAIADILKKDGKSIKILDLSWNCISKRPPQNSKDQERVYRKMQEAIRKNKPFVGE
jgi:hypothetical protein